MSAIDAIDHYADRVSRILKALGTVFLVTSVSITFVNVLLRYIFRSPIFWADEMATLSLIAMVFLPLAFVEKTAGHLHVTALFLVLGKKQRKFCEYLRILFSILVGGYIIALGIPLVYQNYVLSINTIALKVPTALTFSIVVIGFIGITVVNILFLLKMAFGRKTL